MLYVIIAILGILIGGSFTYIICRFLPQEKVRQINKENLEASQHLLNKQEQEIKEKQQILNTYQYEIEQANHHYELETIKKRQEIQLLIAEKENVKNSIQDLKKQARESAENFYDTEMSLAQERLDRALEQVALKYQQDETSYREHYLDIIKEFGEEFAAAAAEQRIKLAEANSQLAELQGIVEAAVAANKREEEKRNETNFYRLILTEQDLAEINALRQVEPYLRDKEALNKVIWKVYYEKPYTDLIRRVVGSKVKTGIYKITNIQNGMCYVGQAVNISERWRQHIKRGIGAEATTRNKLYPAMLSIGVHNFTFELIEECSRDKLDEREDYWQDFFYAREFGYSIK